jgi:uncharacterized membrane protein YraQ (UPF0718 family)
MSGIGGLFIYALAIVLSAVALHKRDARFGAGMQRAIEQGVVILPRMILALIAAGFVVKMIPTDIIIQYLGPDAGFKSILIASLTGLIIPSGPVTAFAVAASFAIEGASVPALIAYVTGWSVFAMHRVVIFEIPLLGIRFTTLRLLAVLPLPLLAGAIAMLANA